MTDAAITSEAATEETIEEIGARIFASDTPVTPEPEVPVVPVAEVPKDPVAEKASARILANQRAEQRAAKQRAEIAAQRAEVEKQRGEVGKDAELAVLVKAAKASPSKALELLGYDPKTFLETLVSENEPEAVAKRVVEGTQTELQKANARIEALEKAAVARERQARERELAVMEQQTGAAFVEFIAGNAEKYPNLVEVMDPNEMVQAGFALLHEVIGKDENGKSVTRLQAWMNEHDGNEPDDTDIAEALEERSVSRAKARSEWRARIGKNALAPSTGTPSVDVRATQTDRGPSPRTLTSRAVSEKAAATPAWSQEAADEESLRILRAALSRG